MRTLDDARKVCAACGKEKPLAEFYRRSDRPDAIARCKPCELARVANYRATREPPDVRERRLAARRTNNRCAKYGLSRENLALLETRLRCDVCGRTSEEVGAKGPSGRRLHIDHDHVTGTVRGVLCKPCNSALGLAEDDPARLRALADYLEARCARSMTP